MRKQFITGLMTMSLVFGSVATMALPVNAQTQWMATAISYYGDDEFTCGDPIYAKIQADTENYRVLSDEEVRKQCAIDHEPFTFFSNEKTLIKALENETEFTNWIPEKAFGSYVYKRVGIESDGERQFTYVRSPYTVTAWDNSEEDYYTFYQNKDKKSVGLFRIYLSDEDHTYAYFKKKVLIGGITYPVTSVANNALTGKAGLYGLTLHNKITSIGEQAFYKAKNLSSIQIEGNLKMVGKKAFAGINKQAVFKIKAGKSNYKKIVKRIKESGVPKTVTFKRIV
ncbi:Leucine rich repeat-containing protein [Lachnospiraceae bacterium XBB1006]|nr:Leucine rich repeat-containing protein [Lachnospiraceae bacterium XBB1006]